MSKRIKMVVFDMAGTTVKEDNLVYKTLREAINAQGFNFSLEEVLAAAAGKEKKQAIKSVLSLQPLFQEEESIDRIYDKFMEQLTITYSKVKLSPEHNAEKLFQLLKEKNRLVVLNTGYDRTTAQSILNKLGWAEGNQIDGLVTSTDVPKNRPEPDMIHFAMKRFHIFDSQEVAKIGDSTVDIEEGQNAGCGLSIGITTGAHTYQQLQSAHPNAIIHDLNELLPLLS